VASLLVPSSDLTRVEIAGGLANRSVAYLEAGDPVAEERDARRAKVMDPSSATASFNLGRVLEATGREGAAEAAYRETLALDASSAEAAGNLARLLVRRGVAREAIPFLAGALAVHPAHVVCRTNLVIALVSAGDFEGARNAADAAAKTGVVLDPELLRAIRPD